jgi:hypothetical protein
VTKKLKDLDTVLSDIHSDVTKTGIPVCMLPMTIFLWIDTNQKTCAPIVGHIEINFHGTINEEKLFSIIQNIDKVTPVSMIVTEGHPFKAYRVTKTEAFMNKPCEEC